MSKAGIFAKAKKGFTLIELVAVMAIMAIAAAIVLPNIRGMISKTEESKYNSLCVSAAAEIQYYTNMLSLGEEYYPVEEADGTIQNYKMTTPGGLTVALNAYNNEPAFYYYALAFEEASTKNNPTNSIKSLINKNSLPKKDIVVVVITISGSKYSMRGVWYYSYEKETIVYSYYAPKRRGTAGFKKLTDSGK